MALPHMGSGRGGVQVTPEFMVKLGGGLIILVCLVALGWALKEEVRR